jgi:hypothetical protein
VNLTQLEDWKRLVLGYETWRKAVRIMFASCHERLPSEREQATAWARGLSAIQFLNRVMSRRCRAIMTADDWLSSAGVHGTGSRTS